MLRQNDPVLHHVDRSFREYAEKMDAGRMRCKFCGHVFAKDTVHGRIKSYLAGVKGRGVKICGQVPQDVQDAALAAIDGHREKKLNNGAGSSNNEVTNAILASAQQQNNEMMMAHREDLSLEEDWMGSIIVEDMEPLERGSLNEVTYFRSHISSEQTRLMESNSGRLVQPGTSANSTKLAGQASVKNAIWSCLMDDKVSIIGIYGMGGNGKPTMLRNICNELQKDKTFLIVFTG